MARWGRSSAQKNFCQFLVSFFIDIFQDAKTKTNFYKIQNKKQTKKRTEKTI